MSKQALAFGLGGIIVGIAIGFFGANSINRSSQGQVAAAPPLTNSALPAAGQLPLPAEHPSSGTAQTAGPLPQVAETIDRAKNSPQDYDAQLAAGDLYYKIQRFDDAGKYYEAAAKLRPQESEPIVKAGNAYFDGKNYAQAESFYLKALEKQPNDVSVRTDLGLTFFLREPPDIDRAIKEYKTSLSIDPGHMKTLQNLAVAYRQKGDTAAYEETVTKLKAVDPTNPLASNK